MAVVLWGVPVSAGAAPPPLDVVEGRLAQLRAKAAPQRVNLVITVTSGLGIHHHNIAASLEGGTVKPDPDQDNKVVIGAEGPLPWALVWVMLAAEAPTEAMRDLGWAIDPALSTVEVWDGDLVFRYGDGARILVSRDMSRLFKIEVRHGEHRWEIAGSGHVEGTMWPARLAISRDGHPYAVVQVKGSQ